MQTKVRLRISPSLLCWVVLCGLIFIGTSRAQEGNVAQKLDIYVSESKLVYLTKPVDEVTSSSPDVVSVEKVRGLETQVSVTGVAIGDGTITVKMGGATQVIAVRVSPMPQRIYINIPESKYLSFKNPVDDYNLSVTGVVRVLQPTAKEILLEALPRSSTGGRTTLTVYSKGEIYRYYISTFENRGADLLEIQNAFTSRGYKMLSVKFENDQAVISGSVSTQEELDDAVRIVKQFTPYVQVKASIGDYTVGSEETEDERVIVNNIQRIAQVKGLIVKVKFSQPQETVNSTATRVVGSPALTQTTTDNQTRLTTTNVQLPQDTGGVTRKQADEGTIETVTRTENKKVPEKIFLFGELGNDLDEAKAIRVARTFCPLIVSMVTVKDPIQLRLRARVLTVDLQKLLDVGILWSSGSTAMPNTNGAGVAIGGSLSYSTSSGPVSIQRVLQDLVKNLGTDISYTLKLGEYQNFVKQVDSLDIFLSNGQPASIFRGQQIPYSSSQTVDTSGYVTTNVSYASVGMRIVVVPLNFERGSQYAGTQLSLVDPDGQTLVGSLSKYYQIPRSIGDQGQAPLVDESLKYVDENGLIGLCVLTSISALREFRSIGSSSNGITAPWTDNKTSMARAQLREGRTLVMGDIFNDSLTKTIQSVPGFNKIPIFGFLFENPVTDHEKQEMLLAFTPEIVHLGGSPSRQLPKPNLPEMMDLMQQQKLIPSVKPVRYDASGIDLRSDSLTPPRSIEVRNAVEPVKSNPEVAPIPGTANESTLAPAPAAKSAEEIPAPAVKPEVAPVNDTADVPAPAPAPQPAPSQSAPADQPKVDTAAPSVNNGTANSTDSSSTQP
jgi:Flp pilus assembly secretin CpaC